MVKLLALFSGFTKYLYPILFALGLALGAWGTSRYYQGKLDKLEASYVSATLEHANRLIEQDKQYRSNLESMNRRLIILQGSLDAELLKPAYQSPVPVSGIKLLNDAIRASQGKQPSQ